MIPITDQTPFPPYIWYPRFLLKTELPDTAKLVYILLLDRMRLSMSHAGWTDSAGMPYVNFSIQRLCEETGKGETAIKAAMRRLREAGLIRCVRQGMNKPSRIYVCLPPEGRTGGGQEERKSASQEGRKSGGQRGGKPTASKKEEKDPLNKYQSDEEDRL